MSGASNKQIIANNGPQNRYGDIQDSSLDNVRGYWTLLIKKKRREQSAKRKRDSHEKWKKIACFFN